MESFSQDCNKFHYFNFKDIRDVIVKNVARTQFVEAIEYLTQLEYFLEDNRGRIYQTKSFLLQNIQSNPNFQRDIEDLKKWVEEKKAETEIKPIYPAKYYAFYHWLKIELGIHPLFEKNENDQWRSSIIKAFAEKQYGFENGQSFYRSFKDLADGWTNKISIAKYLGKDYKKKLGKISNQNIKIIEKLKDWPE